MPDMDMASMPKMNIVMVWTECTEEHSSGVHRTHKMNTVIVHRECTK